MSSFKYYNKLINLLCLFLGVYIVVPSYLAFPIGSIFISLDRILFTLLFLYWIFGILFLPRTKNYLLFNVVKNKKITITLIIFLIIQWIGVFFSQDIQSSAIRYSYYFLYVLIAFFCIFSVPYNPNYLKKIANTLLISTFFILGIALVEIISGENPFYAFVNKAALTDYQLAAMESTTRGSLRRIQSSFPNPLAFGHYIVLILPTLYYFKKRNLQNTKFINICMFFLFFATFFIKSRSVSIILILFGLYTVYYFLFVSKSGAPKKIITTFSILLIGLFVISNVSTENIESFFGGQKVLEDENRMTQLIEGIPIIQENYLTGVGFGKGVEILGFGTLDGKGTIDNYLLTVVLDSGIFALISYMLLLIFIIGLFFKSKKEDIYFTLGFILFIINLFTLSITQIHPIFYFLLALYLVIRTHDRTQTRYYLSEL